MADSLQYCPIYAPLIGAIGIACAIIFSSVGAAYGTTKSGMGIFNVSITRPDLMMRCSLPVIMAGIVALYGVVVDAIIIFNMDRATYSLYTASLHLAAGLIVGFSGLAAGVSIGIIGDVGVRGIAQQPRLFVGMLLMLVFSEVLGMYGFFLGIMLANQGNSGAGCSNRMDGSQVQVMEARLPKDGVPPFQIITENEQKILSPLLLSPRSPFLEEVFPCECRYIESSRLDPDFKSLAAKDPETQACGEHSNCINRTLSIECNAEDCPCRDNCRNQRGQFIIEYVGEILNQEQFEERSNLYTERGQRHYYFMTLRNDQVIDATRKGNLSRFMNHSCNPNCATQKWIVNGRLRIGLFTLRRIKADTELTFDYKFIRFGASAQKCLCGESNCKGVIGEEQKEARPTISRKPTSQQEEDDAVVAMERFKGDKGVEDPEDVALLARLLLRTEDLEAINPLLKALALTESPSLLRRFVSLHGLQIISVLLGLHWRDPHIVSLVVAILHKLPVTNRNPLEDAHIEEKLPRLIQREDLPQETIECCKLLLEQWSTLEHVFRIPRASVRENEQKSVPASSLPAGYSLLDGGDRFKKSRWMGPATGSGQSFSADFASRLPSGWRKAKAPDGNTYYYHEQTRETRWDPPKESNSWQDDHSRERNEGFSRTGYERRPDKKIGKSFYMGPQVDKDKNDDQDVRLREIIERAKNAALFRKSPVVEDKNEKGERQSSEAPWRQFEVQLRGQISQLVVKYLSRWCRDQILSPDPFKELARKLTHDIAEKEMRSIRKEVQVAPDSKSEHDLISSQKRAKIKSYLIQYLRDHGYRVEEDAVSTGGSSTKSNISSQKDPFTDPLP